jgi:hypothetical protein
MTEIYDKVLYRATEDAENVCEIFRHSYCKYEIQRLPHVGHLIRVPRPTVTIILHKKPKNFPRRWLQKSVESA